MVEEEGATIRREILRLSCQWYTLRMAIWMPRNWHFPRTR